MARTETVEIPVDVIDKASEDVDKINAKFSKFSTEQTQRAKSYMAVERQKAAAIAAANKEMEKQAMAAKKAAADAANAQKAQFEKMKNSALAAAGAVVAVGAALKKVYTVAKQGAELEFVQERFDRLAKSIGSTVDSLLGSMKVATQGTLSDFEAMAAATDILSLGLAQTEEQALRLAKVQSGLAMDTNQLVLALTNQTTMRFDQLGVSVLGFEEKVKSLEASGLSASDAFTEAFL